MKTIKLSLDDLVVNSFEILSENVSAAGTVKGHDAGVTAPNQSPMWTYCGSCETPATCTECVSCDPSYCDTSCDCF